MRKCDIGIFGLGIMGQNLALNFAKHGFSVAVYNRTEANEEEITNIFITTRCKNTNIYGKHHVQELISSLKIPRIILIMVRSGAAVDAVLEQLIPFLESGDIVIDGGNSHFKDTAKRLNVLESYGISYIGSGISGGSDGALNGPSIMPGGSFKAWEQVAPLLLAVSAKSGSGKPCCDWIGPDGSGHFVKMIHNGIEYAVMEMIAEVFHIMSRILSMTPYEISEVFVEWHKELLQGYLIEITINILRTLDDDAQPLIEKICDNAGHKGSGKDASIAALELGVSASCISSAVNARFLSTMMDERSSMSNCSVSVPEFFDKDELLQSLNDALCCSQLLSYMEGFVVVAAASDEYDWGIDLLRVANIWSAGSIIQSGLLNCITSVLAKAEQQKVQMFSSLDDLLKQRLKGLRDTIVIAVKNEVPTPGLSAALSFIDGLRSNTLPTNLLQAQRDYFGAHGFERTDAPAGKIFHSTWSRYSS